MKGSVFARQPAWVLALGVALAYFATARLGLELAMPGGHVTPVWPPSGIALAVVLLCGRRVWPGIWLGSFAANLWDFYGSRGSLATEIVASLAIACGAAVTATLGGRVVRHFADDRHSLERVGDVFALLALGGAASCVISATLGLATLAAGGFTQAADFAAVWQTWWLGDTAGVFVVTPLLLAWSQRPSWLARPAVWLEAACCFGLLVAAAYVVFVPLSGRPLAFIFMPLLVWPALRFRARGATAAVALIAALAVWGTVHESGPFILGTRNEALLTLELFLSLVVLTALCLAAVVSEREQAEVARRRVLDELESRVSERTAALVAANRDLVREVAERRSVEVALEHQRAESQMILNTVPEIIFYKDREHRMVWVNAEYERAVGRSATKTIGKTDLELGSPHAPKYFRDDQEVVSTGQPKRKMIEPLETPTGTRWLQTDKVPLRDADGNIIGLVGFGVDITERREAEEKVSQLLAETERSRRALLGLLEDARLAEAELRHSREQLRSLAVHLDTIREEESTHIARELHDELGGLLTGLKMDLAWLLRHLPKTGTAEAVAPLQERCQRAMELIGTTMQSVRRICLELRPNVLDQLGLAEAIGCHAREFEARSGIVCEVVRMDSVPLKPERETTVFRVFQEILTNVLRHAQAETVRVDLQSEGGDVVLAVSDDGVGISSETLARTRRLGIVGMRERALAAGGSLTIEGALGRGTTVTMRIPAGE